MNISIETHDGISLSTDLLIIGLHNGKIAENSLANTVNQKLDGLPKKLLEREKFEGKMGQSKLLHTHGKLPADYVFFVGLGAKKGFDLENIRKVSAQAIKLAKQIKAKKVLVNLLGAELGLYSIAELAQSMGEGLSLSNYLFTRYKAKPKDSHDVDSVLILSSKKESVQAQKGLARGIALAEGISLARDLINTPALDMTPLALADAAKDLKGVVTRIYKLPEIKKMKMGAYLGVALGASNPPAFIEMNYKPAGKVKKSVAIVGKGVTFDSGGLSIKPAKSMETMKDDMSGAAAVIGLMSVIARLNPKVEVWGYVAAAENAVDALAQRPGDIVTAMNGKTIEVLNTDAEGRLTLADAICHAIKKKPDYVIDLATLTGACLVALGDRYSAALGNDPDFIKRIIKAGKKAGEMIWELPLVEEYKEELKSPIADLKNIGSGYGGTINGGLFIQEFVGDHKWVHLDIAGPSWTEKPREYESRGGTGVMVKTLAEFLSEF